MSEYTFRDDAPNLPKHIHFEEASEENNWIAGYVKNRGIDVTSDVGAFQPDELRKIADHMEWLKNGCE